MHAKSARWNLEKKMLKKNVPIGRKSEEHNAEWKIIFWFKFFEFKWLFRTKISRFWAILRLFWGTICTVYAISGHGHGHFWPLMAILKLLQGWFHSFMWSKRIFIIKLKSSDCIILQSYSFCSRIDILRFTNNHIFLDSVKMKNWKVI